ncbi:MAG: iron ABC transporter permease [bacterium]|nr:iron ABC transporter permease [bacterium]
MRDPRVWLLLAVLLGYVCWPIVQVLAASVWDRRAGWTLEPWRQFAARGHWLYAWRSVWISLATVALAGVVGTALAFFYFRLEFPLRGVLAGLTLLPFTLPPLVGVFAIWLLMGENGPIDHLTRAVLGRGMGYDRGYGGVLLVHTYSMFVYFYVLVGGAVAGFDESQLEAARDLGAGRWQAFRLVMLPQLRPALAGAALLTFMTSMASFTAPFFYLAGKPVLTVAVQQALERADEGLASADCVVLVACAGLFLWLNLRYESAYAAGTGTRGATRRRLAVASPRARRGLTAGALALTLLLVTPHLVMVRESLVAPGTGFIGVPVRYTSGNYADLWRRADAWGPVANSLRASGAATAAVVVFTLLSAWVLGRRRYRVAGALRALIMLPWALPGTVIAVGLLWLTRRPGPLTGGLPLRGTLTLLALAYFVRLIPLAHRTLAAGLAQVPAELEAAGRDLGATARQAFLRVTLPLLLPAVVAAATLTFTTAMGEFVSSILLAGPGGEPIAVKIDQLRRGPGGLHLAAAYSTVLLGLIALTFALSGRRLRRSL